MPQNDILYKTFWQNDNEDIFKVFDDGKSIKTPASTKDEDNNKKE
jgi:hypothetical protein